MRKFLFLILLYSFLTIANIAHAKTLNWCGTYFEKNNKGYIIVSQNAIRKGDKHCTAKSYQNDIDVFGSAIMPVDFSAKRSKLGYWRKFNNHLIEIRGKLYENKVTYPHFVRDYGI